MIAATYSTGRRQHGEPDDVTSNANTNQKYDDSTWCSSARVAATAGVAALACDVGFPAEMHGYGTRYGWPYQDPPPDLWRVSKKPSRMADRPAILGARTFNRHCDRFMGPPGSAKRHAAKGR